MLNGMFEHVKFSAITSLEMLRMANVASSGISSLIITYSFVIDRRSDMAVLNSRSRFSGMISSAGTARPMK